MFETKLLSRVNFREILFFIITTLLTLFIVLYVTYVFYLKNIVLELVLRFKQTNCDMS